MNKDNGGPAFPVQSNGCGGSMFGNGMTLRDYLAAKAMQGLLASEDNGGLSSGSIAKSAYDHADAMLEARKK